MRENSQSGTFVKSHERYAKGFKHYLTQEFVSARVRNPRFSLRSFSKKIGEHPSTISQILSGKRKITERLIHRIGAHMGLKPEEVKQFVEQENKLSFPNCTVIDTATSPQLREWYYFAILELIRLKDFEPQVEWVSIRLGISKQKALAALRALKSWGLLSSEIIASEDINDQPQGEKQSNPQKQVLEMAITSLEEMETGYKEISTILMTVSQKQLPKAAQEIEKFKRKLNSTLQQDDSRDEVYSLCIALFPISRKK